MRLLLFICGLAVGAASIAGAWRAEWVRRSQLVSHLRGEHAVSEAELMVRREHSRLRHPSL